MTRVTDIRNEYESIIYKALQVLQARNRNER
jgi:hypothetical protein